MNFNYRTFSEMVSYIRLLGWENVPRHFKDQFIRLLRFANYWKEANLDAYRIITEYAEMREAGKLKI